MKTDTDFRIEKEKQIFVDILFHYEDANAFEDFDMRLLNWVIESPVIIHIVPHVHTLATAKYSHFRRLNRKLQLNMSKKSTRKGPIEIAIFQLKSQKRESRTQIYQWHTDSQRNHRSRLWNALINEKKIRRRCSLSHHLIHRLLLRLLSNLSGLSVQRLDIISHGDWPRTIDATTSRMDEFSHMFSARHGRPISHEAWS